GGRTAGGGGGASGGSIWIQAGTASGSGTIRANGGNGGAGYRAGGGGAGGRISLTGIDTAGFVKGSGFSMTPTATGGTGYASGGTGSIYYNVGGTYTSSVMDFSNPANFTTLTYNKTTTADSISTPTLTVDVRSGNTAVPDETWSAWSTNVASGFDINSFDNNRYTQYRLNLASNNAIQSPKPYSKPTANPSLQDISFNYTAYLDKTLTSSKYNSSSTANTLASIAWDETLDTNTNIRFQMKTSADDATWTDWLGPDGTVDTYFDDISSGCSKLGSTVTCNINSSTALGDGATNLNDQYYQYKAYLETTDGLATPTLNSVTVTYVVNASPIIEDTPTAVPNSSGNVDINYAVRDPDSESGHITPTFKYSLDGGSSWTATTASCFLGAQDLTAKDVNADVGETPGEFLSYSAVWDPSCEIGKPGSTITASTYETDAQIQAIANDGQIANYEDTNNSIDFILDTKPPVPDTESIIISARKTTDNLSLLATDNSAMEMKVGLESDLSDGIWIDYNTLATIDITDNPETAYVQFRDSYGNTSEIESITAPVTPQSLMIQDTSNTLLAEPEYRLFIAWQALDNDQYGSVFDKYVIYRSTDNITYAEVHTISDINTNYWADTVTGETDYYYRVTHKDDYGNESFGNESAYSDSVYGNANGIEDAGEGGGGTSAIPPVITNVAIPEASIYSTQATITWDTDILSDSTVKYSADAGVFTTGKVITTLRNNGTPYGPHTVTLTNLSPNTTYYFQVKSADQNENEATKPQSGDAEFPDGYSFTTDPGPPIHNAWTTRVTNHSATIAWSTEGVPPEVPVPSNSVVTYSENFDLGEPTTIGGSDDMVTYHEVTIDNLDQGTLYYYQVQSSDGQYTAIGKNGDSYFNFVTDVDNVAPEIVFDPDTDITTTDTTARVSWTTPDESATSTLEYGLDTNYALGTLTNDNLNTNHIFDLENLTKDTTYHIRITSTDINGNPTVVSGNSFTTTDSTDYEAPSITHSGSPSTVTDTTAIINWTTNEYAKGKVYYRTAGELTYQETAFSNFGKEGTLTLDSLSPNTSYEYYLSVEDLNANPVFAGSAEIPFDFTTQLTQSDHPNLTNPGNPTVSQYSDTEAVVTFSANTTSTSKLCYSSTAEIDNMDTCLSALTLGDPTRTHYYHLTGLTADTVYYIRTKTTDSEDGSIAFTSSNVSFTTQLTQSDHPNLTNPGNPTVSQYSDTEAVVTFSANTTSTSKLCYSSTAEIDNMDTCLSSLTLGNATRTHYYHLTGLTADTVYYVRTKTTDSEDGSISFTSSNISFTTQKDSIGPTITNVEVSDITYNQAVVRWETDQAGNSLVDYGISENTFPNTQGSRTESVTAHEVLLNGLNSVTTYYYKVASYDADNNITTKSTDSLTSNPDNGELLQFTTLSPTEDIDSDGEGDQLTDVMAQIQEMIDSYNFTQQEIKDALAGLYSISITSSGPSVKITDTQAEITWTTNRPSVGKVYYWQDTDNEDTKTSQSEITTEALTSHTVTLKNLNSNTKYNFYAVSQGLLNAEAISSTQSFSTGDTAQLSGISISNLTLNSADISWTTTGSIDSSQLEYGETIKYGKTDKGKTSSNIHTVNLTDLKENTTYHLRVSAQDSDKQTLVSEDYSFTTISLPVISNVTIKDIQIESATINWQTNVKTDSRVEFKKDGETKGTTSGELEAVTDHTFTLTNLFPGTRYSFKVSSKDAFNNESSSEELSFTTEEDLKAPQITNVKSDTTVFPGKEAQIQTIISWNTDKDSNSILAYREGVEKDPNLVDQLKNPDTTKVDNWKLIKKSDLTKNHLFVLTDLKPASVYQFRTASFDKHNNVSVSENYSLLTPTKQQSVLDLIIQNFESTFGWVKRIGN
ncbi:MAG: fibronectin type III domain-containing protein, partial [Parcubacteria group bacterium]